MLKCNECGAIFDESEIARWEEDRGEFWGQRCFETLTGCPHCFGGDIEEYTENEEENEDI